MKQIKILKVSENIQNAFSNFLVARKTRELYGLLSETFLMSESEIDSELWTDNGFEFLDSWINDGVIGFQLALNQGKAIPSWLENLLFNNTDFFDYEINYKTTDVKQKSIESKNSITIHTISIIESEKEF